MTVYQSIEARPHHIGPVVRALRARETAPAVAAGISVHREVRRVFESSAYRRSWQVDGKTVATGGVVGTLASSQGFVWLALTEAATRHPRALLEHARAHLREIGQTYSTLITTVVRGDETARRFAARLGFRLKHPQSYSHLVQMELRRDLPQRVEPRPGAGLRPFIVYALPRSRTAWMANYLTYGGWQVGHDQASHMRTADDIGAYFARRRVGAVETGAAPGWRVLAAKVPGIATAVVRRPVDAVIESCRGTGVTFDLDQLARVIRYEDRMLDEIARQPGVLALDYADLDTRDGCAALLEHCLPFRFDPTWWRATRSHNIQIDMHELIRYRQAERAGIDGFKLACWSEMRAMVRAGYRREGGSSWA